MDTQEDLNNIDTTDNSEQTTQTENTIEKPEAEKPKDNSVETNLGKIRKMYESKLKESNSKVETLEKQLQELNSKTQEEKKPEAKDELINKIDLLTQKLEQQENEAIQIRIDQALAEQNFDRVLVEDGIIEAMVRSYAEDNGFNLKSSLELKEAAKAIAEKYPQFVSNNKKHNKPVGSAITTNSTSEDLDAEIVKMAQGNDFNEYLKNREKYQQKIKSRR